MILSQLVHAVALGVYWHTDHIGSVNKINSNRTTCRDATNITDDEPFLGVKIDVRSSKRTGRTPGFWIAIGILGM